MADHDGGQEPTPKQTDGAPEGIAAERVSAWLDANIDGAVGPYRFELIAGGHSNLTFSVTDSNDERFVLRRPPLGQVLASAHDMSREYTIISALADTDVPVAPALGLCTDETVNQSPFYVMKFVDGLICRTPNDASAMDESMRRRASESLVDVLAAIHAVDVDAVGLGNLGKREEYIARQLRRWNGQFEKSKQQVPNRSMPDFGGLHDRLAASIPTQTRTSIVHGDYRLDNCILGPSGDVVAVLDWEICTLGDPMADLGLLSVYWSDPGDPALLPQGNYLAEGGFFRRNELFERYERLTGATTAGIGFFEAFGYWKLGCIMSGVYARYAGGSMGSAVTEETITGFAHMLNVIHQAAQAAADRM